MEKNARILAWSRRCLAAVLATVLATSPCLADAEQSSLWADRRKGAEKATGTSANPTMLASAAMPARPDVGRLLQGLPRPASASLSPSIANQLARFVAPGLKKRITDVVRVLPAQTGTVREVIRGRSDAGERVVIHIQDIHLNQEAQANIAAAVRELSAHGAAGVVALEGSFGPIDLAPFRAFPDRKAMRGVADYLTAQNKISGPVGVAMTEENAPAFLGVDSKEHYDNNVAAYRRSAPLQKTYEQRVKDRERELAEKKRSVYSPELTRFDASVDSYDKGQTPLGAYIRLLARNADDLPISIQSFLAAYDLEKNLDFGRVEAERSRMLAALVQKLKPEEIERLVADSLEYRTGRMGHGAFYAELRDLAAKDGVRLSDFPSMDSYVRYVLLTDAIRPQDLYRDIDDLRAAGFKALATTPEERALAAEDERLHLADKLIHFSLTPEEWERFAHEPRETLAFIGDLADFEAFYREAEARNDALTANVLAAMDREKTNVGVLVTGGFHAPGVGARFAKAGVSTISYVPRLTKVDVDGTAYLSVFTQEKTPLDQLFEGPKLFLAQDPAPAASLNLGAMLAAASAVSNQSLPSADVRAWFKTATSFDLRGVESTDGGAFRVVFSRGANGGEVRIIVRVLQGGGFEVREDTERSAFERVADLGARLSDTFSRSPAAARTSAIGAALASAGRALRTVALNTTFVIAPAVSVALIAFFSVFGPVSLTVGVLIFALVRFSLLAVAVSHEMTRLGDEGRLDGLSAVEGARLSLKTLGRASLRRTLFFGNDLRNAFSPEEAALPATVTPRSTFLRGFFGLSPRLATLGAAFTAVLVFAGNAAAAAPQAANAAAATPGTFDMNPIGAYLGTPLLILFGAVLVANVVFVGIRLARGSASQTPLTWKQIVRRVVIDPIWENGVIVLGSILVEPVLEKLFMFSTPLALTVTAYALVGAIFTTAHLLVSRAVKKKWDFRPVGALVGLYVAFSIVFLGFPSLGFSFFLVFLMHGFSWNLLMVNMQEVFNRVSPWLPAASISAAGEPLRPDELSYGRSVGPVTFDRRTSTTIQLFLTDRSSALSVLIAQTPEGVVVRPQGNASRIANKPSVMLRPGQTVYVGASPAATIQLTQTGSRTISRFHIAIEMDARGRVTIRDLFARNGGAFEIRSTAPQAYQSQDDGIDEAFIEHHTSMESRSMTDRSLRNFNLDDLVGGPEDAFRRKLRPEEMELQTDRVAELDERKDRDGLPEDKKAELAFIRAFLPILLGKSLDASQTPAWRDKAAYLLQSLINEAFVLTVPARGEVAFAAEALPVSISLTGRGLRAEPMARVSDTIVTHWLAPDDASNPLRVAVNTSPDGSLLTLNVQRAAGPQIYIDVPGDNKLRLSQAVGVDVAFLPSLRLIQEGNREVVLNNLTVNVRYSDGTARVFTATLDPDAATVLFTERGTKAAPAPRAALPTVEPATRSEGRAEIERQVDALGGLVLVFNRADIEAGSPRANAIPVRERDAKSALRDGRVQAVQRQGQVYLVWAAAAPAGAQSIAVNPDASIAPVSEEASISMRSRVDQALSIVSGRADVSIVSPSVARVRDRFSEAIADLAANPEPNPAGQLRFLQDLVNRLAPRTMSAGERTQIAAGLQRLFSLRVTAHRFDGRLFVVEDQGSGETIMGVSLRDFVGDSFDNDRPDFESRADLFMALLAGWQQQYGFREEYGGEDYAAKRQRAAARFTALVPARLARLVNVDGAHVEMILATVEILRRLPLETFAATSDLANRLRGGIDLAAGRDQAARIGQYRDEIGQLGIQPTVFQFREFLETFLHEFGHVLQANHLASGSRLPALFARARRNTYSIPALGFSAEVRRGYIQSEEEMFAETFMHYVLHGELFAQGFPGYTADPAAWRAVYAFYRDNVFGGVEYRAGAPVQPAAPALRPVVPAATRPLSIRYERIEGEKVTLTDHDGPTSIFIGASQFAIRLDGLGRPVLQLVKANGVAVSGIDVPLTITATPITIGKNGGSLVKVPHSQVSRAHAKIYLDAGGNVVIQDASLNGSVVRPFGEPLTLPFTRAIGDWLGWGRTSARTELGLAILFEGVIPLHFLPGFLGWHGATTRNQRFGVGLIWGLATVGAVAAAAIAHVAFGVDFTAVLSAPALSHLAPLGGFWLGGIVGHLAYNILARAFGWPTLTLDRGTERASIEARVGEALIGAAVAVAARKGRANLDDLLGGVVPLNIGRAFVGNRFAAGVDPALVNREAVLTYIRQNLAGRLRAGDLSFTEAQRVVEKLSTWLGETVRVADRDIVSAARPADAGKVAELLARRPDQKNVKVIVDAADEAFFNATFATQIAAGRVRIVPSAGALFSEGNKLNAPALETALASALDAAALNNALLVLSNEVSFETANLSPNSPLASIRYKALEDLLNNLPDMKVLPLGDVIRAARILAVQA